MGNVSSVAPKLWLITPPSRCFMTYCSAVTICGKPLRPSFSDTPRPGEHDPGRGAITCAHSVEPVSSAQRILVSVGLNAGIGLLRVNDQQGRRCGQPELPVEDAQVTRMVGEPKLSTITMDCPLAVDAERSSGPRKYAARIWAGV